MSFPYAVSCKTKGVDNYAKGGNDETASHRIIPCRQVLVKTVKDDSCHLATSPFGVFQPSLTMFHSLSHFLWCQNRTRAASELFQHIPFDETDLLTLFVFKGTWLIILVNDFTTTRRHCATIITSTNRKSPSFEHSDLLCYHFSCPSCLLILNSAAESRISVAVKQLSVAQFGCLSYNRKLLQFHSSHISIDWKIIAFRSYELLKG